MPETKHTKAATSLKIAKKTEEVLLNLEFSNYFLFCLMENLMKMKENVDELCSNIECSFDKMITRASLNPRPPLFHFTKLRI